MSSYNFFISMIGMDRKMLFVFFFLDLRLCYIWSKKGHYLGPALTKTKQSMIVGLLVGMNTCISLPWSAGLWCPHTVCSCSDWRASTWPHRTSYCSGSPTPAPGSFPRRPHWQRSWPGSLLGRGRPDRSSWRGKRWWRSWPAGPLYPAGGGGGVVVK